VTAEVSTWAPPWTPVPAPFWDGVRRLIAPYVLGSFVVPGDPQPKERPRTVKGHTFTPQRTKDAEQRVHDAFRAAMPDWQTEPDGTYGVLMEFNAEQGSTADLDNLTKLVWDALNTNTKTGHQGLWLDDIQVGMALLRLVRYGDPGATVWVFGMDNNGTRLTTVCECGTRYRAAAKMCAGCTKRRKAVAELLRDDDTDTAELAQLQRRAFSYLTACTMGTGRAPATAQIAQHLGVSEARARAVIEALIGTGSVARVGRKLKVIRPLGVSA
jgi:Holliday junction resolvase RusA-like endonuclease